MMKSLANAVGGKTARACDSCVKRRARWYCAADDAFLCHSCDGSVHLANPLARRHERVRLKSASPGKHRYASSSPPRLAMWHQGFTRKARTPRGGKKISQTIVFHDLVPEMSSEDMNYEVEEQLIFQVPEFNPTIEEQYCLNESVETSKIEFPLKPVCFKSSEEEEDNAESCINGLFPTDMELAQFTADVETLLGGGIEREFHAMEEVGLGEMLKIEKEEVLEEDEEEARKEKVSDLDDSDETSPFEISFDYEYSHKTAFEEDDDEKEDVKKNTRDVGVNEINGRMIKEEKKEKALMLRLNYEAVISTWGGQGIPWSGQEPPNIDLDMVCCSTDSLTHHHNHIRGLGLHMGETGDGGREARVSRYREKRRTRLFSKKIRYEVRKLNAEKRPRMKGRFVKRSSIAAAH